MSIRSEKKAARGGTPSRKERRNDKRQNVALAAWEAGKRADSKGGGKGFNKPGAEHFH
jgi:hypothetical protein